MSVSHGLKNIGLVAGLTGTLFFTLLAALSQVSTAAPNPTPSQPVPLFSLTSTKANDSTGIIDSTHNPTITYAAPDGNWNGMGIVKALLG